MNHGQGRGHCALKRTLSSFLLVGGLTACDGATYSSANCDLKDIPDDAREISSHGLSYFVYPTSVQEGYTGCQTIWLEDGTKLGSAEFVGGDLRGFSGKEPKQSELMECRYKKGKLVSGSAKCPPATVFPW